MNTEAEDLASRLRIVEALERWNAVTKGVNAVSNDDERAERIFGHEMKALERVFGLLNPETICHVPEKPKVVSRVIDLKRRYDFQLTNCGRGIFQVIDRVSYDPDPEATMHIEGWGNSGNEAMEDWWEKFWAAVPEIAP